MSEQRRRASDHIDPAVQVVIDEGDRVTRHDLRNEFTTALVGLTNQITGLAKAHADSALREVQDHAEFRAHLSELDRTIKPVQDLEDRVTALEQNDAVLAALASNRKAMWAAAVTLAGLIVAATSVLAGLLA